jgi:Zn-finger nucleic acid-binding protein
MAEENQGQEDQKPVEKPVLTEIETRAADQGWRPKDEWDGDPEAWRPAKEFLDRGELFKKIDQQNRELKEFKKTLDQFAQHHARVAQAEYKRAKEDLLREKKEALIEGDADAVIDIDEKLAAVREAQKAPPPVQPVDNSFNELFVGWVQRNGWYETNEAMRAYADRIGNKLGAQGDMSPNEILREVEQAVKKEFAAKFENPNRNKPSAVEGGSNKATGRKETFQLSEEERRVMQRFVKTIPGMTEEKYMADLKKIKER